jgi:5-methylcytosine-specific restriction enzyme A
MPKPRMAERRKASWLRARAATLERDGDTCQRCGATVRTSTLHVHHVLPRSEGGLTALDNLLTVCERCHPIVERERSVFLDRKQCDTSPIFREGNPDKP